MNWTHLGGGVIKLGNVFSTKDFSPSQLAISNIVKVASEITAGKEWGIARNGKRIMLFRDNVFIGSGAYFSSDPDKWADPNYQEILDRFQEGFTIHELAEFMWPHEYRAGKCYCVGKFFSEDRHIMLKLFPDQEIVKRNMKSVVINRARSLATRLEQWFEQKENGYGRISRE